MKTSLTAVAFLRLALELSLLVGLSIAVSAETVPSSPPVADPLTLALFHFDGNIDESSNKGSVLTLGPNASVATDGRFGGALQIQPRSDLTQALTQIKLPGFAAAQGSFACSLWVKIRGVEEGTPVLVTRDNYVLTGPNFYLRYAAQRKRFEVGIRSGKGDWVGTFSTGVVPNPGEWNYLAMAYDGSELSFSVNGIAQSTKPVIGAAVPTVLTLGSIAWDNDRTSEMDGWLDELMVSSVASSTEPPPGNAFNPPAGTEFSVTDSLPRNEHPLVLIPQTSVPPPLTGDPSGPRWERAAWVGNPVYLNAKEITPKIEMRTGLMWDQKALYVGFKVLSFRKPASVTTSKGDDGLERDDAVEVCFIVPGFKEANGRPVQFKLNCAGLRDDAIDSDFSWNGKWDGAVKTEGNGWSATFRIPFDNFGVEPKIGDRWLANLGAFLVGYDYRPFLWSSVAVGSHHHGDFGTFEFGGLEIPQNSIGKISSQMSTVNVTGTLGSKGSVRVLILDGTETKQDARLGGFLNTNFDSESGKIVAQSATQIDQPGSWAASTDAPMPGAYLVKVILMDAVGKILNTDIKPIVIQRSLVTKVLRYPIKQSAEAVVSIYNMGRAGVLPSRLEITVLDASGAPVLKESQAVSQLGIPISVSLGKLVNEQSYKVDVRAISADGKNSVSDSIDFTLPARPLWADTKAGDLYGKVLKPWTPIQAKGTALSCWGRTYDLKDGLMPAAILSSGHPVLAGPIQFVAASAGQITVIRQADQPATVNVTPTGDTANYRVQASNNLCGITVTGTLGFDGFMTFDVAVLPKKPLDSFSLEIPIDNSLAKFMQPLPNSNNRDHAGNIPAEGVTIPELNSPAAGFGSNSVWICNGAAGLFFICDSLENWSPPKGKTVELIRRGKDTLLRFNFYQADPGFAQERHYQFHLQATPIRPFNPGWYKDDQYGGGVEWGDNTKALEPDTVLSLPIAPGQIGAEGTFEMIVQNLNDLKAITAIDYSSDGGPDFKETICSLEGPGGQLHLLYAKSHNGIIFKTPWGTLGLAGNAAWKPNEKHKLAFTWGDQLHFYVDGQDQGELPTQGLPIDATQLKLGSVSARFVLKGLRMRGSISDLASLSSVEAIESTADSFLFRDDDLDLRSHAKTILSLAKERGCKYVTLWENWNQSQNGGSSRYEPLIKDLADDCHRLGLKLCLYFGFELSTRPEFSDIFDECRALVNQSPNYYAPHKQDTVYVSYGGPYQEYLLDNMARLKRDIGIDGVFLDGSFGLTGSDNPAFGCGYTAENGDRVSTVPVERIRQFAQRVDNIFGQDGGYVFAHIGVAPPTMGYANQVWQGEHLGWLNKDWQDPLTIIPIDTAECAYNGVNTGVGKTLDELNMWPGLRKASPYKWYDHVTALTDLFRLKLPILGEWPVTFPSSNESSKYQRFVSFGVDDSLWIPFWDIKPTDVSLPSGLMMSAYRRKDGAMLCIVSNFTDHVVQGQLQFKNDGPLAVKQNAKCSALMTGEIIPFVGNAASLSIPSFEHQLIVIE